MGDGPVHWVPTPHQPLAHAELYDDPEYAITACRDSVIGMIQDWVSSSHSITCLECQARLAADYLSKERFGDELEEAVHAKLDKL